jgi:hypothetical protein
MARYTYGEDFIFLEEKCFDNFNRPIHFFFIFFFFKRERKYFHSKFLACTV